MSRHAFGVARAAVVVATAGSLIGASGPAVAQTETPAPVVAERRPVIDRAPGRVSFRSSPRILGHLENSTGGEPVSLQRRRPGRAWRALATKTVSTDSRVAFRVADVRRTARYRLTYRDEATGVTEASDPVRIAVRPKLRFALRPRHVMAGKSVTVTGRLYPALPGRRVAVQKRVDGYWRTVARPRAGDGSFAATFRARHKGLRRVRVRFAGDAFNTRRSARRAMRVYRRALATWYGPGLYGNRTACGQRYTADTLGVAHKRLPCGTRVDILYGGRTISVPVIDRGPYSSADFDLSGETADRLNFSGRGTIGVTVGS